MTTEIIAVNYWKEMRKELHNTVNNLHGLVLLTHNSVEFSDIVDFLNMIRKEEHRTILYISLVNSYNHIKTTLEKHPLISKKISVVDCVSGFLIELQDCVECVYRKPPNNLAEMKELILKNNRLVNPDIIMVDSLTQFINFTMPKDDDLQELYKFLRSLRNDALGVTNDTIILLYDDKLGSMKKLPSIFADLILKLEVIREEPEWKD